MICFGCSFYSRKHRVGFYTTVRNRHASITYSLFHALPSAFVEVLALWEPADVLICVRRTGSHLFLESKGEGFTASDPEMGFPVPRV